MMPVRQQIDQARGFLLEVSQEMRKISWPTPREIVGATSVVIVATAALAMTLAVFDWFIARGLGVVLR